MSDIVEMELRKSAHVHAVSITRHASNVNTLHPPTPLDCCVVDGRRTHRTATTTFCAVQGGANVLINDA